MIFYKFRISRKYRSNVSCTQVVVSELCTDGCCHYNSPYTETYIINLICFQLMLMMNMPQGQMIMVSEH